MLSKLSYINRVISDVLPTVTQERNDYCNEWKIFQKIERLNIRDWNFELFTIICNFKFFQCMFNLTHFKAVNILRNVFSFKSHSDLLNTLRTY